MERRDLLERLELLPADSLQDDAYEAETRAQIAQDAELAARLQSVQSFDARVTKTIGEMATPAGLTDRILARLRTDAPATGGTKSVRRFTRRYWLAGIGAAALLLVAGVLVWRQWPDPSWTRDRIAQEAVAWYLGEKGERPRGVAEESPAFAFAGELPGGRVVGSREVQFLGRPATVYRLKNGDDEAFAFVVERRWFSEAPDDAAYARQLEVRFFERSATGQVCILVGSNLDGFLQRSAAIS